MGNLRGDGWLVITGKWSAFALQHSISTVCLGRAGKESGEKEQRREQIISRRHRKDCRMK